MCGMETKKLISSLNKRNYMKEKKKHLNSFRFDSFFFFVLKIFLFFLLFHEGEIKNKKKKPGV